MTSPTLLQLSSLIYILNNKQQQNPLIINLITATRYSMGNGLSQSQKMHALFPEYRLMSELTNHHTNTYGLIFVSKEGSVFTVKCYKASKYNHKQAVPEIKHPYVLDLVDCNQIDDDTHGLVYQWMPQDLGGFLKQRVDDQVFIQIMGMCLEAYSYLRTMPENMYLDFRPENIRVHKTHHQLNVKVYSQLITKMESMRQYRNTLSDLAHVFWRVYDVRKVGEATEQTSHRVKHLLNMMQSERNDHAIWNQVTEECHKLQNQISDQKIRHSRIIGTPSRGCSSRVNYPMQVETKRSTSPIYRPVSPINRPVSPIYRPVSPIYRPVSPISRPVSPIKGHEKQSTFYLQPAEHCRSTSRIKRISQNDPNKGSWRSPSLLARNEAVTPQKYRTGSQAVLHQKVQNQTEDRMANSQKPTKFPQFPKPSYPRRAVGLQPYLSNQRSPKTQNPQQKFLQASGFPLNDSCPRRPYYNKAQNIQGPQQNYHTYQTNTERQNYVNNNSNTSKQQCIASPKFDHSSQTLNFSMFRPSEYCEKKLNHEKGVPKRQHTIKTKSDTHQLTEEGGQQSKTVTQINKQLLQAPSNFVQEHLMTKKYKEHDFEANSDRLASDAGGNQSLALVLSEDSQQEGESISQEAEGCYSGTLYQGTRHGLGKLVFQSDGCYSGSFKCDKLEGYGKLFYASGRLAYEGCWQNNKFEGLGKLFNENPIYIENFNYRDFSEIESPDGASYWKFYEGSLHKDMKDGQGVLMLENGEKYEGQFHRDMVHGRGTFYGKQSTVQGRWEKNILTTVYQTS